MIKRIGIRLLFVLVVGAALSSCQKLPARSNPVFAAERIRSTSAIAPDYGNLVTVTSSSNGGPLLWFERSDKSIVVVGVIFERDGASLADNIVVIPRR